MARKAMQSAIEIGGVLSPTLQAALEKAAAKLEKLDSGTLAAAGAAEKLAAEMKIEENTLKILEKAYTNYVVGNEEGSEEAQQLAQHIQNLSSELDENRDTLENAQKAAERLASGLDDTGDEADQMEDSLNDAGEAAKVADEGFTVFKATLANLAADAIQSAISGIKDLAGNIVELGTETETSFAQLETIAGAENIDGLTESLSKLSKETGIASSDLAVTAYNAISAGTDAKDAAKMVETASKLAKAGFTDTDSALSVLTTAINSYGDEAGTASEIADSLITVQNLGVTTIGGLANAMGKAIATGSAYGVNLSNLESAYISLTKGGISTEESTTYLSSMLKELGDTGSDVSKVIEKETGHSFAELMESGSSLSDVLGVVYDSLGEDSTAMMNLWGSAEAGKASNAIISQGLETFNDNLDALGNSAGSTEEAYETMADTLSTKTDIMKQNFADLGLEIFNNLEPSLSSAVDFVTASVIPAIEWAVNHLPEIGGALTALGAVIAAMKWDSISKKLDMVKGAFKGIAKEVGGVSGPALAIIAVIAALALAFSHLWKTNDEFREKMTNVWDVLSGSFSEFGQGIADMIEQLMPFFEVIAGAAMTSFMEIAETVFTTIADLAVTILPVIIDLMNQLIPIMTVIVSTVLSTLINMIAEILPTITQIVNTILPILIQLVQTIVPVIMQIVQAILPVLAQFIQTLAPIIAQIVQAVLPVLVQVINALMPVLSALANIFTAVLGAAIQAIMPIVSSLIQVFQGLINFISGVFSGNWSQAWNGIVQVFGGLWDGLVSIVKAPINAVIGLVNRAIRALNKVSVKIPDWVPVMGGKSFGVNIPTIQQLASGGFTDGVSIAGEAGMEAVISFDRKYRSENIAIWEKAGQLLGTLGDAGGNAGLTSKAGELLTLDDFSLGSLAGNGGVVVYYDFSGFTWSPQIRTDGSGDEDDLMARLRAHEAEFFDWLDEFIQMREVAQYA